MRWKCTCQYDGTDFFGWQSQPSGDTIQDHIEARLNWIFGRRVCIHGSGRTDAGVHANGQIFHFDAEWPHGSEKLLRALRCGLPRSIRILSAGEVDSSFHARFSIKRKCYKYNIIEDFAGAFNYRYNWCLGSRRLDLKSMQFVADKFCGEHNFSAFSANRGDGELCDPIKTIHEMQLERVGSRIILRSVGSGYLYKMVRMIVGCFVMVGMKKISIDDVLYMLLNGRRVVNIEAAPANGLFLEYVEY